MQYEKETPHTRIRILQLLPQARHARLKRIGVLYEDPIHCHDGAFPDMCSRMIEHGNQITREVPREVRRGNMGDAIKRDGNICRNCGRKILSKELMGITSCCGRAHLLQ